MSCVPVTWVLPSRKAVAGHPWEATGAVVEVGDGDGDCSGDGSDGGSGVGNGSGDVEGEGEGEGDGKGEGSGVSGYSFGPAVHVPSAVL